MSAGTGASGVESAETSGLRGVAAKTEPVLTKGDKHTNPREIVRRKRRLRTKMRMFMEGLGA